MQDDIKIFVDKIFSVNPTASTVYGSALNVGSRDMSGGGISNSASDTVFKLRKETASMVKLVTHKSTPDIKAAIKTKALNIEGYLMLLQTLGQISNQAYDDLIAQMRSIIRE